MASSIFSLYFVIIFLQFWLFLVQGKRGRNEREKNKNKIVIKKSSHLIITKFGNFFNLVLIFTVAGGSGGDELIFEDGYTVTTVINGDKSNVKVNPQSILHQSPPSDLFIILDSVASTFYTTSLPTTSNGMYLKTSIFSFII